MTSNDNEETVIASATPHRSATSAAKPPINSNGSSQDRKMKKTKSKKKKESGGSGAFGIFKAALFMLRKKNGDKPSKKAIAKQDAAPPATTTNPNWTKLVDSMRPLHLQETPESPPAAISGERAVAVRAEDIIFAPPSPAASSSTAGTMSRYASAQSLRDLYSMSSDDEDDDEEEEDPDAMFDTLCGDEMIDTKAEEFIARFYRQIKLQNSATHHQ